MSRQVKRYACEDCGREYETSGEADGCAKSDAQDREYKAAEVAWRAVYDDHYLLTTSDIEKVHALVRRLNAEHEARDRGERA